MLELWLGKLTNDPTFFEAAIRTALAEGSMPCGSALRAFLAQIGANECSLETKRLLREGIEMSWRTLELDGAPPGDMAEASRQLGVEEGRPRHGFGEH